MKYSYSLLILLLGFSFISNADCPPKPDLEYLGYTTVEKIEPFQCPCEGTPAEIAKLVSRNVCWVTLRPKDPGKFKGPKSMRVIVNQQAFCDFRQGVIGTVKIFPSCNDTMKTAKAGKCSSLQTAEQCFDKINGAYPFGAILWTKEYQNPAAAEAEAKWKAKEEKHRVYEEKVRQANERADAFYKTPCGKAWLRRSSALAVTEWLNTFANMVHYKQIKYLAITPKNEDYPQTLHEKNREALELESVQEVRKEADRWVEEADKAIEAIHGCEAAGHS